MGGKDNMKDSYSVKLLDIVDEGSRRATYIFEKPDDFNWEEGSHISLGLDGCIVDGMKNKSMIREFSIATTVDENKVVISTRLDSSDSEYKKHLSKIHVGDTCSIFGCGSRMKLRRENKNIVLISMGVGMATMRPLITSYLRNQDGIGSLTNIVVNRSNDYLYKKELVDSPDKNYKNICYKGRKEYKEMLMKNDYGDAIFYIVGSNEFLKDSVNLLRDKGVAVEDIMIDKDRSKLEAYYDANSYENMQVKNYGASASFTPLAFAMGGCSCGGNCTCK